MFSIDTETGFDKVVLINAAWGLGENVVQGAVDPDEYQVFKPLLDRPELTPILEKRLGAKEKKMIYDERGRQRRRTRNVPTSKAERARFVLADDEILHARPLGRAPSSTITAGRWTWNGRGTARPASSSSCRRGPRRCSRARGGRAPVLRRAQAGEKLLTGLSVGDAAVAGRVCLIESAARHRPLRRRRDPRHLDHRPRLGADHEARRGDRHRPRRPHLPRRHRQPRARPARDRRHRQRDASAP